jgi:hypothetical protein
MRWPQRRHARSAPSREGRITKMTTEEVVDTAPDISASRTASFWNPRGQRSTATVQIFGLAPGLAMAAPTSRPGTTPKVSI